MRPGVAAYSLIEMMVALGVMSTLLVMSVGQFEPMLETVRIPIIANDVQQILAFAQHTALVLRQPVLVCGEASDHLRCGSQWQHRLMVMSGGQLLRRLEVSSTYRLVWSSSLGRNQALTFLPTGLSEGQDGRVTVCSALGRGLAATWSVVVTRGGRLRRQYERSPNQRCAHP